ncbi:hypothetical protein ES703_61557 [subsurface metagenome]
MLSESQYKKAFALLNTELFKLYKKDRLIEIKRNIIFHISWGLVEKAGEWETKSGKKTPYLKEKYVKTPFTVVRGENIKKWKDYGKEIKELEKQHHEFSKKISDVEDKLDNLLSDFYNP